MCFKSIIYLFLAVLGLHCCVGFSLVVASGGCSSLQCMAFLLWWFPLLWSTGSKVRGLQQWQHVGSAVVAHRFWFSKACGIFPDQGSNLVSPALTGRFFTTEPHGSPWGTFCYTAIVARTASKRSPSSQRYQNSGGQSIKVPEQPMAAQRHGRVSGWVEQELNQKSSRSQSATLLQRHLFFSFCLLLWSHTSGPLPVAQNIRFLLSAVRVLTAYGAIAQLLSCMSLI